VNVKLDSKIILKMLAPEDNDHHFWGQMLGGPDLSSFLPQHFKVAATNLLNSDVIAGDVTVDLRGSRVVWTPRSPLLPRTHYTVIIFFLYHFFFIIFFSLWTPRSPLLPRAHYTVIYLYRDIIHTYYTRVYIYI
jgi:hypothetical protein